MAQDLSNEKEAFFMGFGEDDAVMTVNGGTYRLKAELTQRTSLLLEESGEALKVKGLFNEIITLEKFTGDKRRIVRTLQKYKCELSSIEDGPGLNEKELMCIGQISYAELIIFLKDVCVYKKNGLYRLIGQESRRVLLERVFFCISDKEENIKNIKIEKLHYHICKETDLDKDLVKAFLKFIFTKDEDLWELNIHKTIELLCECISEGGEIGLEDLLKGIRGVLPEYIEVGEKDLIEIGYIEILPKKGKVFYFYPIKYISMEQDKGLIDIFDKSGRWLEGNLKMYLERLYGRKNMETIISRKCRRINTDTGVFYDLK
eukprot:GHVP01016040.1.p1 GENE.GHVP01016040.1~~GHVP01016040.1.p1  ORF type:complete len:344 (+),score=70.61 GHVP01016040.1:82-1032(+)